MTTPSTCETGDCNKFGLPILPVLALPVPADVPLAMPAELKLPRVTGISLQASKYVLRSVRQGFIYVFYESRWKTAAKSFASSALVSLQRAYDVYSVAADGSLWKQASSTNPQPVAARVCSRNESVIPTNVFTIEDPLKAGIVWIAFSGTRWSLYTMDNYANDTGLRAKRMQSIDPVAWQKGKSRGDAIEATRDSVHQVLEFSNSGAEAKIKLSRNLLTQASGAYDVAELQTVVSKYPPNMRPKSVEFLVPAMVAMGGMTKKDVPADKPFKPMMLALHDAVGVIHELNNYRKDALAKQGVYNQERDVEVAAADGIAAAQAMIHARALDASNAQLQAHIFALDRNHDAQDDVLRRTIRDPAARAARMGMIDAEYAEAKKRRLDYFSNQAETDTVLDWPRYQNCLRPGAFEAFNELNKKFIAAAAALADRRTPDVVSWALAPLLVDTLLDFDKSHVEDGVLYNEVVSEALEGINASPAGEALLKTWAAAKAPDDVANLLWRSIALNQTDGAAALKEALAHATKDAATIGMTFDFLTGPLRKTSDLYKKANSVANTLAKVKVGALPMYECDSLFLTAGDKLMQPWWRVGVDTIGERVIQGIMLARAEEEPGRIIALLNGETKNVGDARVAVAQAYLKNPSLRGAIVGARYANMADTWEKLLSDAKKSASAMQENRLSLIMVLMEAINTGKTAHDWFEKGDPKAGAQFVQAGLSLTSAALDVVANAAKQLSSVGDKSAEYQKLKMLGGRFSAVSGLIGVGVDAYGALDAARRGAYGKGIIYFGKSASQLTSTYHSLMAARTYALPATAELGEKEAADVMAKLLARRLSSMVWAARFNMLTLVLTGVVFLLKEDKLKTFMSKNCFGAESVRGTTNAMIETKMLRDAVEDFA